MNDQTDNPYAAPQAPPEKKPRAPVSAYIMALIAGIIAFAFAIIAVLLVSLMIWMAVRFNDSAPLTDAGPAVKVVVLALCGVLGTFAGVFMAREDFRQRTIRGDARSG